MGTAPSNRLKLTMEVESDDSEESDSHQQNDKNKQGKGTTGKRPTGTTCNLLMVFLLI